MRAMMGLFHLVYQVFGDRIRVQGRPLLKLETIGAKSGARRRAVVGWFPDTLARSTSDSMESWLVVASNAGSARHPAWFLNLARHPDQVWITLSHRRIKVTPETLDATERERAWQGIASLAPGYAAYPAKTDRLIPIVRLKQQK